MSRLLYSCTNENLNAIIAGLAPTRDDTIIAVGGAGDQGFALLEYESRVVITDNNPAQIAFIQEKAESLRAKDYQKFLDNTKKGARDGLLNGVISAAEAERDRDARTNYFTPRVEAIAKNIKNLVVLEPMGIETVLTGVKGYNKVYFSNIFGFLADNDQDETLDVFSILHALNSNLPKGGLVYFTNNDFIRRNITYARRIQRIAAINGDKLSSSDINTGFFWPESLELDIELSKAASNLDYEDWKPGVYRKIA